MLNQKDLFAKALMVKKLLTGVIDILLRLLSLDKTLHVTTTSCASMADPVRLKS